MKGLCLGGLLLFGLVTLGSSQTCLNVFKDVYHCLDGGDITLKCSTGQVLLVDKVLQKKAPTEECPTDSDGSCQLEVITGKVKEQCDLKNSCTVNIPPSAATCEKTGAEFVKVTYKCQPENAADLETNAVTLCQETTKSGSSFEMKTDEPLTNTTCRCMVSVPANTEVTFLIKSFSKDPPQSGCSQSIKLYNEGKNKEISFCQESAERVKVPCQEGPQKYAVEYSTYDASVMTSFVLDVMSSTLSHITLECGHPQFTTTTTSTTLGPTQSRVTRKTTATTSPRSTVTPYDLGEGNPIDSALLAILIVSVIVLFLFIFLLIWCVIAKRRREKEEEEYYQTTSYNPYFQHWI